MLIDNLDIADKVVEDSRVLRWQGWDIVKVREAKFTPLLPDAFRVNDKWYIVLERYPLTLSGWAVPDTALS